MKQIQSSHLGRLAVALALGAAISCGREAPSGDLPTARSGEAVVSSLSCPPGFNKFLGPPPAGALPFVPLASLKTVANPVVTRDPKTGAALVRGDLTTYLADATAAIQLGKAFFWDVQAGSDNKVACAT